MIVGVTGPSGVGKTTFCKYFSEKGCTYVDVDQIICKHDIFHIVGQIGRLLNDGINYAKKNNPNIVCKTLIINKKSTCKTRSLSLNNDAKILLDEALSKWNPLVNEAILIAKKNNSKIIVVDFILLNLLDCWQNLDKRILITKKDSKRMEHLKNRPHKFHKVDINEKLEHDFLQKRNSFFYYNHFRFDKKELNFIVKNNNSKSDFLRIADKIYNIFEKESNNSKY